MSKQARITRIDKYRKVTGILFIIILASFFLKTSIGNYLLEIKGNCINSTLTNKTTKVRYHRPTLVYSFYVHGKVYYGNSNVEDLSKAGGKICIVYLEWMPSINRPLSYFDNQVNCNCK